MESLLSRLNRCMCLCVLYVYIYVIEVHAYIGYYRCMLCSLACTCSRLILHHVGCSGFTKLGSGSLQNVFKRRELAHGRARATHGRDEQGEGHPVKPSRP